MSESATTSADEKIDWRYVVPLYTVAFFLSAPLGRPKYRKTFCYSIINLLYALFEEIFWRGYLQDRLRPLAEKFRYLLIGVLWWAWHFRFQTTLDFTAFLAMCIVSSFLIGGFVDKTKSFFVAASLHCLVILLSNSRGLTRQHVIAGVLTIIIWIAIDKLKKKSRLVAARPAAS